MGLTILAGILAGIAGLLLIPDVLEDNYDDYDDRPPTYKSRARTPPRRIPPPPTLIRVVR